MLLGIVVGTVVASRKEAAIEGLKLLIVRPCEVDGQPSGRPIVAADAVGTGVGEVVLFAAGSSARQTDVTNNKPVDHTIMAVVDMVVIGDETRYQKD